MRKRCPELTIDQIRIIQGLGYFVLAEYSNYGSQIWQRWFSETNTRGNRYAIYGYQAREIMVEYRGSILEKNLPYPIHFKSFDEFMSKIVDFRIKAKS